MLITVHLLKYTILLILQHIDTAIRHGEIGYIFRWVIRKQKKNPAIHSTKQLLYILLLKNEDKKVIIYIYIYIPSPLSNHTVFCFGSKLEFQKGNQKWVC